MKYAIIQIDGEAHVAYVIESPEDLNTLFEDFPVWHKEAREACKRNMRIEAIKIVRQATGWNLKPCKDYVDQHFPR